MTDPLLASEGWGVIHCYYRLTGDRREAIALADAEELAGRVHGRGALPGDLDAPARRPRRPRADADRARTWCASSASAARFARTDLGRRLEPVPELGLVSMTELSEYTPREGSEEHMAMLERRVAPAPAAQAPALLLPDGQEARGRDNWYSLDYDQRRAS